MKKEELKKILDICSSQSNVKVDVFKNHDNNLWWPLEVTDYRLRLLIAGLSTRISYSMIENYRKVIENLTMYTYEEIKNMKEDQILKIIKPLGLFNTRYKYIKSMINFIENHHDLTSLSNEELIEAINKNVTGASYKVAQCCTLYMKGYYESGIMPVDSGMKDMLLPCLVFPTYKAAIGHDYLRKELEKLVKNIDLKDVISKNGYNNLKIPDTSNATWWSHLVLIYFKRHFCNKHKPEECPLLKAGIKVSCKCAKNSKISV